MGVFRTLSVLLAAAVAVGVAVVVVPGPEKRGVVVGSSSWNLHAVTCSYLSFGCLESELVNAVHQRDADKVHALLAGGVASASTTAQVRVTPTCAYFPCCGHSDTGVSWCDMPCVTHAPRDHRMLLYCTMP